MNIMWIPLLSGSHRAAPAASDGRPIRPLNLPQSPSAVSTSARKHGVAREVPGRGVSESSAAYLTR